MWQRFTERARVAVWRSTEEAAALGAPFVGAEHLLLGLLADPQSIASRILSERGGNADLLRADILRQVIPAEGRSAAELLFTPRFKKVIDAAYADARELMNNYIGTEHLLLGLLREGGSLGALVLRSAGIEHQGMFERVRSLQSENQSPAPQPDGDPSSAARDQPSAGG